MRDDPHEVEEDHGAQMKLSFRFGTKALGVGIFYHAQKRILYVHPLPLVAVLVDCGCRHVWNFTSVYTDGWLCCKCRKSGGYGSEPQP